MAPKVYWWKYFSRESSIMKTILLLTGLSLLTFLGGAGCESDHDHHEYRGGAYDRDYRDYGHGEYRSNDGHYTYDHYYDR